MPSNEPSARLLAGLLAGAAVAHAAAPSQFDAVIPRQLPGKPRTWTQVSGAVELALAIGIAVPRTRRMSAYAAAGFFVAVTPANVQMAYNWRRRPAPWRAAAIARVPLQIPLVLWARNVARAAGK
ncbi:DoxX family protein [Streptodolium elevatio]|uniref:DoxX family membrane protein n=1 Tax=Streptodolium elevatio TaxID=3157996 RepID=A0ABV3DVB1_9ACTN